MADILGYKLPESKTGQAIAVVAVVSIPAALVFVGARALYRKFHGEKPSPRPETDEEIAARLEQAHRGIPA